MSQKEQVQKILQQAKRIRQGSRTSCVQLQNYLYYQFLKLSNKNSSIWACNFCSRPKAETKQQFRRAFKTLTKTQQAHFYLMNVKNVQKFLNTRIKNVGDVTQVIEQPNGISQQVIKMKFQIMDGNVYKKYSQVNASILPKEKSIRIQDTKQQYDLHNYILRKSKSKNKNVLVLESIQSFTNADTVRLAFSNIDFQDSYQTIQKVWSQAHYQNIKKILIQENKFPRKVEGRSLKNLKSSFQFEQNIMPITPKLLLKKQGGHDANQLRESIQSQEKQSSLNRSNRLNRIQNSIVPNQLVQSLNTFKNFQEQRFGVYFGKDGNKVRKSFVFHQPRVNIETLINAIDEVRLIRKRKPTITQLKHLNSIPSERTNLYRQVNLFQKTQYQFTYFRHTFNRNGMSFLFEKSVDLQQFKNLNQNIIKATINYCIWRIKKMGQQIQLLVQADVNYNKKIKQPQQITASYIGQFNDFLNSSKDKQNKQLESQKKSIGTDQFQNEYLSQISNNQQEFFTVNGSQGFNQFVADQNYQMDNVQILNPDFKKPMKNETFEQDFLTKQTLTDQNHIKIGNILKHKFQLMPNTKGAPQYLKEPDGHIIWGRQWKISESGQLVNLNKQKIKLQSSVLKLVLQRMGRNLITGKSIMNMSLPIQIFGTDSNIERIARGYSYAPIFLQKAAELDDPVERLKYVFCFGLGFSITYIKMQKPFNPVLGETYQGLIDGCPVYAEQISHHPPISSMLMYGRGYRVYGNFEAKVQMGMNYASGLNEGFNNIQFQRDKSTVRFNTPPGEMHGIIIGDRKLTLTKKSYYIDERNRLLCEVTWGKNKHSQREFNKMNDFYSGKIVKIKEGVNMHNYKKIKPKDIQQQYGQIHGRFHSKVCFQDDLLLDFEHDAPLIIQDYSPSLQSDSRWRKDIIERRKNNFNTAQQAKQQIQNLQRHDKKIRKHHK